MTVDYPDWTRLIQLIGADIMMPIDVQAAYIMMPIDIQAQYVNLEVDIVAQTVGNIGIDIKAATIGNIGIDIKANTLGNLTIDIEAQSIGIYLKADWEVLQGTDKNLSGYAECPDGSATFVIDYTVVADTAFIICQWGFNLAADCGGQASLWFRHNATDARLAMTGGRMGNSQSFSKPIAVVAGDHIKLSVFQVSGAAVYGYGCVGGYEI